MPLGLLANEKGERVGLSGKWVVLMDIVNTNDKIVRQSYGLVPLLGTE